MSFKAARGVFRQTAAGTPAQSKIGKCSGRVNIAGGELLIALRAYLDSSGKLESNYLTLAAVAATDEIWSSFETEWARILETHTPKASYIHMRELAFQVEGFDKDLGWTEQNAFNLSNKCLIYMSHLDKKRFRVFYCMVDLKAWRKLRAETYQIPEPVEMCNAYCSETVIGWYLKHYPDIITPHTDSVKYFFDRSEYFFQPFFNKWNEKKDIAEKTGEWTPWRTIEQVTPVEMKKTPGVQAADIVAWAVNREHTVRDGQNASHLAKIIRGVLPSLSVVWDEDKMRQQFKPLLYLP